MVAAARMAIQYALASSVLAAAATMPLQYALERWSFQCALECWLSPFALPSFVLAAAARAVVAVGLLGRVLGPLRAELMVAAPRMPLQCALEWWSPFALPSFVLAARAVVGLVGRLNLELIVQAAAEA